MVLFNKTRQEILGPCQIARSFLARLRGLLSKHQERDAEGLWLTPCHSIHTVRMPWPIDALFLDRRGRVLRIVLAIKPFTLYVGAWKAISVVESFSGTWDPSKIAVGDELEMRV